MPVLRSVRERFARERPLDGLTVGACLHITSETAVLVRTLQAGGASVALAASNPFATQADVALALSAEAEVHAGGPEEWADGVAAVVARSPRITLDDGADLLGALHLARPEFLPSMLGGTEETTTGLMRLRSLEANGELAVPVIAVNEARAERGFNDRFGAGQSVLDGIIRATNLLLAGQTVVVLGYGWTGRGVALRAHGMGASVIVCEVDPLRALEARMEGFQVMPALRAAALGDIFITVTGVPNVLHGRHFFSMKDGAVLANAGQFDVEISLDDLRSEASSVRQILPLVERFEFGDRALNLLAGGRVVNLAAAQGHPAAVMDVSFALQALSCEALTTGSWSPGRAPGAGRDRTRGRGVEARRPGRRDRRPQRGAARLPLAHNATARPLTLIGPSVPISTVSRLGRPMSSPWWMVIVAGVSMFSVSRR